MAGAVTVARLATLMEMDLAAYRQGLKTAKTEGDAGAKSIARSFKDAFKQSATGQNFIDFRGLLAQARAQRTPLREVFAGVALDAGRDLRTAIGTAIQTGGQRGIAALKGAFSGFASAGKAVLQGIFQGIGIGIFQSAVRGISDLIHAIPDLIQRGREYSIVVDQISDATGATAEASSRLAGTLQFLGAPIGSIISLLGQMSRNLEENEPKLNALGVVTRTTTGALLNQVQILENARQAFSRYGDGTAKANLIAREFGRGGLTVLVDYLKLTDEQAQKVTADLEAQGLIISESQRQMAETAQREGNRFQNALTGLGVTLFNVVGPQITAFFSNLSNTITEHATEISNAIAGAVSFILGMVSALVGASGELTSFSGSLVAGSRAASPYSAQLLQLNLELADLDENQKAATDSTDAQRKAIQRQIDVISGQIAALDLLERQQDRTYQKALEGLNAQLDAQEKLLDAEDEAAQRAERDIDLAERLRQAKIDLFEAQAQLRADQLAGDSTDKDVLDIAEKSQAVIDAQKAIAEEARRRGQDERRAEIQAVQDYIESIATLLEEADNKKAALNTLRRREEVLEARRQAQLAAGDTEGAADTALKIEAIKTAETRAQEEIRNASRRSALDEQKRLLEEEKSAVKAAVVDTTAIRRRELEQQIADLQVQNDEWEKLTGKQKDDLYAVTFAMSGPKGLTEAMRESRDAGVEMGEKIKEALAGIAGTIDGIVKGLGELSRFTTLIADLIVLAKLGVAAGGIAAAPFTFAGDTTPPSQAGGNTAQQKDIDYLRTQNPQAPYDFSRFGTYDGHTLQRGMTNAEAIAALIKAGYGKEAGGWIGKYGREMFVGGERGREYVLDNALSEKLDRFFSVPRMPAFAAAAGVGASSGTLIVERLSIDFGDRVIDQVDQKLKWRRR